MNCRDSRSFQVDEWMGVLDAEAARELADHLAQCAVCREEHRELGALWRHLGALEAPATIPSSRMRRRFDATLVGYGEARRDGWWAGLGQRVRALAAAPGPLPRTVAATLLVAIGLAVGWTLGDRGEGPAADPDTVGRALALSLLEHPSASERLRAVGLSAPRAPADDAVLSALVDAARHDPNVNVRLAAVDALASLGERPAVRAKLLGTLEASRQPPLVQWSLIEALVLAEGGVSDELRGLIESDAVDPTVRDRLLALLTTES